MQGTKVRAESESENSVESLSDKKSGGPALKRITTFTEKTQSDKILPIASVEDIDDNVSIQKSEQPNNGFELPPFSPNLKEPRLTMMTDLFSQF